MDQGGDAFARVLDEMARAELAGEPFRLGDDLWALLAARIALAMSNSSEASVGRPAALHRRFEVEGVDEPSLPPSNELPDLPTHLSRNELERLRRLFARVNHPDRAAPADRESANRRMAAFNRLIDDRLSRRSA